MKTSKESQGRRYYKVWVKMTQAIFQTDLTNRLSATLYILGKVLRFAFFLGFLFLLLKNTQVLANYSAGQIIFFFLTFNLIDILAQLFLRGIYHFRPLIVSGNFDFLLVKPINPLFTSLASHTDVLDLITLFPLVAFILYFLVSGQIAVTFLGIFLYLILLVVSLLIACALHIFVVAIGVMTTEVDHLIWIYRDLSGMGRFPLDIYHPSLRFLLTFVIPVGILMNFPAKALMGLLSWPLILFSVCFAIFFLLISFRFWNYALRRYTSASS